MFELPTNPEGVSYSPTVKGHAWVLPRRSGLGKLRLLGLVPIVLSLIFPAFIWFFFLGFFHGFSGPSWVPIAVPLVISVLVLSAEWKFWRFGLALLIGRSEVRIEGEEIVAVERLPLRSWKRRLPMANITKVEVSGPSETGKVMRNMFGVTLYDGDKKWPLVIGYPLGMLEPIAAQVADRVSVGRREPVEVVLFRGTLDEMRERDRGEQPGNGVEPTPEPVPDQPADSRAIVTENAGELSIELPPIGIVKGSKGMFAFAIVWNLIVSAMVAGFVIAAIQGTGPKGMEMLIVGGVFLLFGGIGVLILLNAISMGRRYTIIDVVGDSLLISTTTPFRTRQHTFLAEDLGAIKAGASGTEINDVPVIELQIYHRATPIGGADRPTGFAKLGLLSSRPDDELRWLAALLRDRLRVPAMAPDPDLGRGVHLRVGSTQVI